MKSDSSETDFASRLQVMMASKHSSVPRLSSLKLETCFKSSRKTDNKFDFLCCSAIDLPNKNVELPPFFFGMRWQKTLSEVSSSLYCLHMGLIIKQQGNLK